MIKRISTPERENAGAVFFPVLMKKHVEDEKLRSSVADLQILVATGEVAIFNITNVDDVIFDVFPETGVIRHVEPPAVRRCGNRKDIPEAGSAPTEERLCTLLIS